MRRAVVVALALFLGESVPSGQGSIIGHWTGVASRQGADLPIEFHFQADGKQLDGSMTAKTLAGLNIPLANIGYESNSLRFDVPTDNGKFSFSGTVRDNSLSGSWNLFGFDSTVSMRRTPPEGVPYLSEQVSCQSGNVILAGTLLTPMARGARHPAIVFVHGSGPAPRQGFNFLADQFARLGVASVSFDKRGSGLSTGDWRQADFGDLAHDVLSCVAFLKARNEIDPTRIGLFGQSQGGWVTPLATSLSRDVAFMILVSAAPMTPAKQGWWEAESRLRGRGIGQAEMERAHDLWQLNDEVTRTGQRFVDLQSAIERAKNGPWLAAMGLAKPPPVDAPFRIFYRRIIDFDPVPILQKLSIPSLWVYGTEDEIVPSMESAAILNKLKREGRDITVRTFTGADHALWVMSQAGQPFQWPGLVPGYVDYISDWLLRRAQN